MHAAALTPRFPRRSFSIMLLCTTGMHAAADAEVLDRRISKLVQTLKANIKMKGGQSATTAMRAICMLDECCCAADPHDAADFAPVPPLVELVLQSTLHSLVAIVTGSSGGFFSFFSKSKSQHAQMGLKEKEQVCTVPP